MKRCRQRVDAGEPRHSYQSQTKPTPFRREFSFSSLSSFVANQSTAIAGVKERDNEEAVENNVTQQMNSKLVIKPSGKERPITPQSDPPALALSYSGSRRKSFQPKRQGAASLGSSPSDLSPFITGNDSNGDGLDEDPSEVDAAERKSASEKGDGGIEEAERAVDLTRPPMGKREAQSEDKIGEVMTDINAHKSPKISPVNALPLFPSLLTSSNNGGANKLQELFFENQRRFYALLLEQQQRQQTHQQLHGPTQVPVPNTNNPQSLPSGVAVGGGPQTPLEPAVAFQLYVTQQQHMLEIQRDFQRIACDLKEKLIGSYSESTDRVVDESFAELLKLVRNSYHQQLCDFQQQFARQRQAAVSAPLPNHHSNGTMASATSAPGTNLPFLTSSCGNLFAAAAAAAAAAFANNQNSLNQSMFNGGGGDTKGMPTSIFPPLMQQMASGGGLAPPNGAMPSLFPPSFNPLAAFGVRVPPSNDEQPRKKRSKVTDSVRGPRSLARDTPNSLSGRSTPQVHNYFPPTMVSNRNPFLVSSALSAGVENRLTLGGVTVSRNGSPGEGGSNTGDEKGSEEGFEDAGALYPKSTLTHVHLRKAKLMFFYTRYPSSAVLKSYFPDIHFNKNNTAQLVKWFSNFREFFYMQMEKYAKQALAEGIRHRDDIRVTIESEIYKQLNLHYNRNNIIQPPSRLRQVIEETLKEFFSAIQLGKDTEPSWKKVIYKVIQQLDEPIPDYFKDPHFISTLEHAS